jgi:hypothetical protein
VGVLHGLLVAGAIGLIAVAPCLVCLVLMSADRIIDRCRDGLQRCVPRRLRERVRLRRLERRRVRRQQQRRRPAFGGRWTATSLGRRWQLSRLDRGLDDFAEADRQRAHCPPIEQVAGDLRRLNRLRGGVATRSRVWFVAVQEAYDEGLRVACGQLGVEEHLGELGHMDLDLERLRVEGELQRAGLVLRDAGAQQR